jgi:hypothetical protein
VQELETVTVTMPIHPLFGRRLRVFRHSGSRSGRKYLIVEYPLGRRLRLPEAWTDRVLSCPVPTVSGRTVRLAAKALLRLSQAVAGLLAEKVDKGGTGETLDVEAEHRSSHAAVARSTTACATVVSSSTAGAEPVAGGVGGADAQGASAEGRRDGGRS